MKRIMCGLTTKKELDLAMHRELKYLKSHIAVPNINLNRVRNLLTRGIYCETLGYSATFLYIHAVKLAQQGILEEKRIGYLAATIFLNEDHELTLLLINTILKDLKSNNTNVIAMALTTSAYIANREMVPILLTTVEEMIHSHPKVMIRKKAILALRRLLTVNPSLVDATNTINNLKMCVEDDDPEVVATFIHVVLDLAKDNPQVFRNLTEPCLNILSQILQRKFPYDYDHQGIPAPWLQIDILKLLSLLVVDEDIQFCALIEDVLKNIDTNNTISAAVLYQCVCTVICACRQEKLLEVISSLIAKFLYASTLDLKYMGLKALFLLITKVHPKYATLYQDFIIESLRHADTSIRNKAFDILICLVNASNINLVWPKLLKHVGNVDDLCAKRVLVTRCSQLLKLHSPNKLWAFENTLSLINKSPSIIHSHLVTILKDLFCTGINKPESDLILIAVHKCSEILQSPISSSNLIHFSMWVLCNFVKEDFYPILTLFAQIFTRFKNDHQVQSFSLFAIKTLLIKNQDCCVNAEVEKLIKTCSDSSHCTVRHQAKELHQIMKHLEIVRSAIGRPEEDSNYDWTLCFLDGVIENALLSSTSSPYFSKSFRNKTLQKEKFEERTSKTKPAFSTMVSTSPTRTRNSSVSSSFGSSTISLNVEQFERTWTKDGFKVDASLSFIQQSYKEEDCFSEEIAESNAEDSVLAKALFESSPSQDDSVAHFVVLNHPR